MGKRYSNSSKRVRSNEQIRAEQVRLIDSDGEQLGVMSTQEGIQKAQDAGLDLVEVAANVNPPVCRILDLSKYLYALARKDKESRKKQKTVEVKEIKISQKIEEHDYQTKLRNARRFLTRGDKVKLRMFFRGREITHKEIGEKIVQRFIEDVSDIGEVERNDGLEGNAMHLFFSPLPKGKVIAKNKESENAKIENK